MNAGCAERGPGPDPARLHPVDMHHGEARAFWLRAIRELLPSRQALTKIEWLRRMP